MSFIKDGLGSFSGFVQILGWTILALLPIAILLLYFLKLRRVPLEVPSTFLWARTIEDLHVNSLWQKLRQSLLLFLQLLIALLLILALLRPGWMSSEMKGDRFVFLIDASASMAARVKNKTRLDIAKQKARDFISGMSSSDTAMLISFSDTPIIEQSFTNNHSELIRKLNGIRQTHRHTNLDQALRAASGLANPGRSSQDARDIQVADALAATLVLITDGGINKVPDFSLGNLTPVYVSVGGEEEIDNIGIVNFSVSTNPESPEKQQAFARVSNASDSEAIFDASLYLNDILIDAVSGRSIKPRGEARLPFDLAGDNLAGVLRLELEVQDDLESDNIAHVVFNSNRRSRILLVTMQNAAMEHALTTLETQKLSFVDIQLPSYLETEKYKVEAGSGYYDFVIYDGCAPDEMPDANTLFIGSTPPYGQWKISPKQSPVIIVDSAQTHPLLSLVELNNVLIADSSTVEGPKGSTALIDATIGTIFAVGPRGGFQDAVMGFNIVESDGEGGYVNNTDWPRYISFPLFVRNVVSFLGSQLLLNMKQNVVPGSTLVLRSSVPVDTIQVTPPGSRPQSIEGQDNSFVFAETDELGVYEVVEGSSKTVDQKFAVNILSPRESDIRVLDELEIGFETVEGKQASVLKRFEFWKWILIAGLVVLCIEWYIYNKRVYI